MPLVPSKYQPPFWAKPGFVSTIYSGLARQVNGIVQFRDRIILEDGDFLDLDWSYSKSQSSKVIILLHGLEGNAQRPYITGTAKLFNRNNIDACAVNFRGCSGKTNRLYRSYHSGATEDLEAVVNYILKLGRYHEIFIKGISLGGNITLKYLGERDHIPKEIKAAVAISTPCDLLGACNELHTLKNNLYALNFLDHLKKKLKIKIQNFPEKISEQDYNSIKTLLDFDQVYTSKAHGFKDAFDYYDKANSLQFLPNIKTAALLINARNDSFLSNSCYPVKVAEKNKYLHLEIPRYGGHVGFISHLNWYYNEQRALEFVKSKI